MGIILAIKDRFHLNKGGKEIRSDEFKNMEEFLAWCTRHGASCGELKVVEPRIVLKKVEPDNYMCEIKSCLGDAMFHLSDVKDGLGEGFLCESCLEEWKAEHPEVILEEVNGES